MAEAVPRVAVRPAPWTERVLFPIAASALFGGWLALQVVVVWVVLSLDPDDIPPTPAKEDRVTLEPAMPRPGAKVRIKYDFEGVDERFDQARLAIGREAPGEIRKLAYVTIPRAVGWAEYDVPDDTLVLLIQPFQPSGWSEPHNVCLDEAGWQAELERRTRAPEPDASKSK